ncbi:DUF4258 domain-containing protein [Magnetospirillum sp. 15-1]|uniref:DUF4258 domain-containing protein n=1 Tax=Magnetospirillum sp. 15-1 TaxID=1979370 RepID=UPI000BBC9C93|nr:DUF4258 domain-containing protein [Magnetospirillum sp. 15-1]
MSVPPDSSRALERHRLRLRERRFVMSEHVVRSLMSGSLTVADIVATVRGGTIIEVHTHARRGTSLLLAARCGDRPVHVMCADGVDDWLVIPFAYVPARPVWATPGRRNPKGVPEMNGKFTNCYFCGGEIKTVTVGNFDYRKEGVLYVIKKVPAGLCVECGEKYIEPAVGERMDFMIQNSLFTTTEPVNVIEFPSDS